MCLGPLRFVPGGLVTFRVAVPCRAWPLRAVSCSAEHKIGVFVSEMGVFSEIFGRFDTKMGFLCSGSITMVVPANHRARSQNANT